MPAKIVYRQYLPSDAAAVVALWNGGTLGSDFPMDARLWRQNVDHCEQTITRAAKVACDGSRVVGVIVCKTPHHLSAIAVAPTHQRQGIGRELVQRAEMVLAAENGAWVAGQDNNHFFPGVPDTATEALAFFDALGFVREEKLSFDVVRDLEGFTVPPAVQEKIATLAAQGIEIDACGPDDVPALLKFLAAAFPGRWLTDTVHRLKIEPDPGEIIIARRSAPGDVIGFAHTYSKTSQVLGPPVYWRPLLGEDYGGLGPIGVAPEARGIGLGLALLCQSVEMLRRRGVTRMAIDWTDLVDFYAKAGFAPWKRYLSLHRP